MNRKRFYLSAAFILIIGVFVGLALSSRLEMTSPLTAKSQVSSRSVETLSQLSDALSEVAGVATPSVVNIASTRVIKQSEQAPYDFFDDPFFRRFFGDQLPRPNAPKEQKEQSLGSGVIVSEDGYIVTNNHVIEKSQEIKVLLSNKRDYKAKLIGADPKTDIAVIKIEATGLAALPWGDSTKLRVGEIVFAIGNPFGLNQTVTMGVIGAVGRANVGIADYEDFIQTDAAINPGNSGGALINARGELVGINTAIVSRTGGYQGIGFAVPSSMARQVMESLIKYKKVVRGWLGVSIQEVTSDLAEEFGVKDLKGALVSGVMKGSPAEKAGLKQGDVILKFNGKDVEDTGHLRNMVSQSPIGTKVKVKVFRAKKELEIEVTIAELPKKAGEAATEDESGENQEESNALSGVTVRELTPELAKRFGAKEGDSGLVVVRVDPNSKAFEVGIRPGDIVLQINQKDIATIEDFKKVIAKLKAKERVLLLVRRKGEDLFLTIRPE
ncbi:MAG: DegQ family serine endoprotease [Nitrospirae bacterium]|nr:DegQ family serine endoprotease [Nitrospirota bacterium]NTW67307.1 DegQ family serine endoprotease [Nitrospirota bacterium]